MRTDAVPRTDRWLVAPEPLYLALRDRASASGGFARLRFDSGHVEPVAPETLFDRAASLLAAEVGCVRLIVGAGGDDWRSRLDDALARLVDVLPPDTQARLRVHEDVLDPGETGATLDSPDEAVLERWLDDGRPVVPALDTPADASWIERYRAAFADWRADFDHHYGEWVLGDDAGAAPLVPVAGEAVPPRGGWIDVAANEPAYRLYAGGGSLRGAADEALRLIGRWSARVGDVALTLAAFGRADVGADVRLVASAEAATFAALTVELRDPSGAPLARAELSADTTGEPGAWQASAELANPDDTLLETIRAGGVGARLAATLH